MIRSLPDLQFDVQRSKKGKHYLLIYIQRWGSTSSSKLSRSCMLHTDSHNNEADEGCDHCDLNERFM